MSPQKLNDNFIKIFDNEFLAGTLGEDEVVMHGEQDLKYICYPAHGIIAIVGSTEGFPEARMEVKARNVEELLGLVKQNRK